MILFSVLIANYNNARYISRAIRSVIQQSYRNWEIILVDDASTDDSVIIINEFIKQGVAIRFFRHDQNLGVGATKRDCVAFSNGEIAGFLDPDDSLTGDALTVMVEAHLQHPAASIVYSTHYCGDETLEIKGKAGWVTGVPEGSTNLLVDKVAHFVTFKKSAYLKTGGINPALHSAEDKDIYYQLEEQGPLIFVNKPLYIYREHRAGVSQFENYLSAQDNHLAVIEETIRRRKGNGFRNLSFSEYRYVKSRIFLQRAELLVKLGYPTRQVLKWLLQSFIQHPVFFNPLRIKYLIQSCLQSNRTHPV